MKNGGCPNDQFDGAEFARAEGNLADVGLLLNWSDFGHKRKRHRWSEQFGCSGFAIIIIAGITFCFERRLYRGGRVGKRHIQNGIPSNVVIAWSRIG